MATTTFATINFTSTIENGLAAMLTQYGHAIVRQLCSHYKLDVDEALRIANIGQINLEKKTKTLKEPKEKVEKAEKVVKEKVVKEKVVKAKKERMVPNFALPFCGVVMDDWCKGIRANQELYTQCTLAPFESDKFCKACRKSADGNDGVHPLGEITDRADKDLMDYEVRGKKVVPYGNVLAKLGKSREEAIAEAARFGWEIAEEQFETRKGSRGRPRSNSDKSSGDDAEKKQRGRPRKAVEVINGSTKGNDVIAELVRSARENEAADADLDSANADIEAEVENPWKAAAEAVTKTKAPKEKKEKIVKEKKEKIVKEKVVKENTKVAEPVPVPVAVATPEASPEAPGSESGDEEDEEIKVDVIKIKGKDYMLVTSGKRAGKLYDRATEKGVGMWNAITKKIEELPADMVSEESDDDDEDDDE
jgi:hypothetical protein